MKILTVGASPYIHTRGGRINSFLLSNFKKQHDVISVVWHHDINYFVADDGKYTYNKDEEIVSILYPIFHPKKNPFKEKATIALYEIIKQEQPDIVLSIGDIDETDFLHSIKQLIDFKWIGIFTIASSSDILNPDKMDFLESVDFAIHTNKKVKNDWDQYIKKNNIVINSKYYPIGINFDKFYRDELINKDKFIVLNCSKNSQYSNLPAFIEGFAKFYNKQPDVEAYLHTNINDPGNYNILWLLEKNNMQDVIKLPEKYASFKDNISDEELNSLYNRSCVLVDCATRSATGLCVKEAIRAGCVPLVTENSGAISEFVKDQHLKIKSERFIGENEEDLYIASIDDISNKLKVLYRLWKYNKKYFIEGSNRIVDEVKNINDLLKYLECVFEEIFKENKKVLSLEIFN